MNWFIDQEVELTKGAIAGEKRTNITPLAYPGSANAHQWRVYVKNHGIPLDLTGNTVTAYFQRSDGNVVVVQGDTIDNMAYVIIPAEVYAISGIVKAYMDVVLAGTAITPVAGITFNVPQNMSGDIIDPGEVIPASLEELLAEIDAMRQATAEARAVVSNSVRYDTAQTLTDAQKEQARGNIDAASEDNVADIKSQLNTITNTYADPSLWEQGAINISNGANANSSVRLRTAIIPSNVIALNILSGYECAICCYSGSTYAGAWNGTGFSTSTASFFTGAVNILPIIDYDIRLYLKSAAGTAITIADATNVLFSALTDGTLTKQYIPADAKKTGDAINAVRDSVIEFNSPFVKLTKSSDIFTVEEGYYATTGNKIALAGYVLCSYVAEQDFQIYADAETIAGNPALFVSIYNNSIASGNNVACYKRSDGTLPTEASKATVYAGQILAISIYSPSFSPADFGIYANYYTVVKLADGVLLNDSQIQQVLDEIPGGAAEKFTNFANGKKIAWFGDSISELKSLPHIAGNLMSATVYDCSIRGSTIGRTYSNYDTFSFYNLVTAILSGDFSAQFAQLDAYEQAQGRTYPGIRENLTTLSTLNFNSVDYVVLLQGTNDFGITAVHAAEGYNTKVAEMQARMDNAISRFITAYPKLKFYIISPPFRATPTEDYYGDTLADYIAAEQMVAEKYAMPFYNLLTHSRICDENKTTYMNSDGGVYVHPNDYGDAWLAELVAKFISVN